MEDSFIPVYWHWLALAALLMTIELLAPGLFFIWVAVSALVTGGILWLLPAMSLVNQLGVFSLLAVFSIVLARRYVTRHQIVSDQPLLNRRMARHIGTVVLLEEPIIGGRGRIRLDGSIWNVTGADCPKGIRVRITAVAGITLQAERLTEP